jgi:hypothetical protein
MMKKIMIMMMIRVRFATILRGAPRKTKTTGSVALRVGFLPSHAALETPVVAAQRDPGTLLAFAGGYM